MTSIKRFEILAQGYVRNRDIVEMFECSKAKASGILKKVKATMKGKWYVPFEDAVPTKPFLDFVGWDLDEIHALAKKEAEIKAAASPWKETATAC